MSQAVRIVPVRDRRGREVFLRLPERFYRGQPAWVPPLLADMRPQLDPAKGEYFKHSTGEFYLAYRGDEPVGRIAALHNRRHLEVHPDGAGFFGFFECEDNPATAAALLAAAETWLRGQGLKVARGPANFSVQDEAGVLLDGFAHAPMVGMGYTPPYYRGLVEAAAYGKAKDLFVYRLNFAEFQTDQFDRMCAVADRAARGVTLRSLNTRDLPGEAKRMALIFAEAWHDNWGAVPITEAEFLKYSQAYRLFINPEFILLAERDGEPLGMMVAIPNMNEIVQRVGGRLWPLGWWTLLTQRKRVTGIRLFLLGVRKQARRLGLPMLFIRRYHQLLCDEPHLRLMEFSWILEDNHETIALIERIGGKRVQTLRLYEKAL